MRIDGKEYRTVWMEDEVIKTINQVLLPDRFELITIHNLPQAVDVIRKMYVRGAPAIGALGVYAFAQAISHMDRLNKGRILEIRQELERTRPTAHDLTHGLTFLMDHISEVASLEEMKIQAMEAAQAYADSSVRACQRIGEYGNTLIQDGARILTHCNAGALATVDHGTALGVIRSAHYDHKSIHVFVDETRPRLQGSKLTAWELLQEDIPHSIITDNAAGYFMQRGDIDLVITGADRIAANGDTANKIGTYEKAVLAQESGIPFYVAAPLSTIDFNCRSGDGIPIEEREEVEVLEIDGKRLAPPGSHAKNPAFDITPARFIQRFITEKGIFKPEDIRRLVKEDD